MDRRVDVRHFVHHRSCDISSSNMAAYERWPRVNGRGTKYSSEVCRMAEVYDLYARPLVDGLFTALNSDMHCDIYQDIYFCIQVFNSLPFLSLPRPLFLSLPSP